MNAVRSAPPEVSVIIPVLNDARRLELCLAALALQTVADKIEIIVIDNGSTDGSDEVVAGHPNVRLLRESIKGSYAARNTGLTEAKGKIFAFTDSDCIPATNWVEQGIKALGAAGDRAFVGGAIELFAADPEHPTAAETWELMHAMPQRNYIKNLSFAATANLFASADAFAEVGPFSAGLVSSGDAEWGQRATAAGWQPTYAEEVVVAHPCRTDLQALRKKMTRLHAGRVQRRMADGQPLLTTREAFTMLKPPTRSVMRKLGVTNAFTFRMKVAYVYSVFYLKYTTAFDRFAMVRQANSEGGLTGNARVSEAAHPTQQ